MRQLNNWIESYVKYNSAQECSSLFAKWVGISIIASALQRKCYVRWGKLKFYPNFYIVLVGPPGRARKGTAMRMGKNILKSIGIKTAPDSITREAFIRYLQKSGEATGYDFHSSVTIYSEELTVFMDFENKKFIDELTDLYDCSDDWTYETKNMGTDKIENVWVNLLGATTPSTISGPVMQKAAFRGLASRMILVYNDKKILSPYPVVDESLESQLIHDLNYIYSYSGEFKITEDLVDFYMKWYAEGYNKVSFDEPLLEYYLERRAMHIWKLSMIVAASRQPLYKDNKPIIYISAEDFQNAIKWIEEVEVDMAKALSSAGSNQYLQIIQRVIQTILVRKKISENELISLFYKDISNDKLISECLVPLERMGKIKRVRENNMSMVILNS